MRWLTLFAALVIGFVPVLASAQSPPEGTPTAVRGTVEKLDGRTLTVKTKAGETAAIMLAENFTVSGVAKRSLADFKPGELVATNSVKSTDGKLHAVEMHLFLNSMRAQVQEVQRPSSLVAGGVMTNVRVIEITSAAQGHVLKGKYKDADIEIIVDPDTPLVTYVPGDPSLLKPGAAVTILALKKPDGSLTSARVTAEKDGVKPPM